MKRHSYNNKHRRHNNNTLMKIITYNFLPLEQPSSFPGESGGGSGNEAAFLVDIQTLTSVTNMVDNMMTYWP